MLRLLGLVAPCLFALLVFLLPLLPPKRARQGRHQHARNAFHVPRRRPNLEPPSLQQSFGRCGHGRYRDPHTRKCRGRADFGN